jgi:hypothetical protein
VEALQLILCTCEDGRFCKCSGKVKRARVRAAANGYRGPYFTASEWFALVEECGGACLACGSVEELTVDHIIPCL